MSNSFYALKKISHTYHAGTDHQVEVLKKVDLSLEPGQIVALMGPSGSGKSTLLHIAGLLEAPSSGSLMINGVSCEKLQDKGRTGLRRHFLGFVYQFHHLLPEFSAEENIILPQMIAGVSRKQAYERAQELLVQVGLPHRATHRPARLSGGEQQRVAIARALANRPKILLADEPTGNLDEHTGGDVFDLFCRLARQENMAALIATHNNVLASKMDHILSLHEGRLDKT